MTKITGNAMAVCSLREAGSVIQIGSIQVMQPWQLILIGVAGWLNRKQQQLIEYLLKENRVRRDNRAVYPKLFFPLDMARLVLGVS